MFTNLNNNNKTKLN